MNARGSCVALLAGLLIAAGALAGQSCELRELSARQVQSGLTLALKVRERLDESGAQVALIGRVGRDLSEYGLRYSHAGLAVRDHPKGRWMMVHVLNHCGRPDSDVYDEGLGNFFLDDLFLAEAVVLLPSIELQSRTAELLARGGARMLHEPRYSLIAHPYSTKYQNSNQWLLEFLASALADMARPSRLAAQAELQRAGYVPSSIGLPPLKRLGARLFAANTKFDDHSIEEWSSSQYRIVSVESVLGFLSKADRPMGQFTVKLD